MLVLYTSGSTGPAKKVEHSWEFIYECAAKTVQEQSLSMVDIVIDVFPHNSIAHWTLSALPAFIAGAEYHSMKFTPKFFIEKFKEVQPTILNLVPRHLEMLQETEEFETLDMSCVRYMTLGAAPVTQKMVDAFTSRGVTLVAVTYGMTECPPPMMVGYNSPEFSWIDPKITFTDDMEAIIGDVQTGDFFKKASGSIVFSHRAKEITGKTWKDVS